MRWVVVFLGQILSFAITGTGISSEFAARSGVDTSVIQVFFSYLLISLVYLIWFIFEFRKDNDVKSEAHHLLKTPPTTNSSNYRWVFWLLILNSISDVAANILVVKAYQFTSISQIMLLDCFTIPFVVMISRCWLQELYTHTHILGMCLAMVGLAILVSDDVKKVIDGSDGSGSDPFKGDVLCLCGSLCYAISNCVEQRIMTPKDGETPITRVKFLAAIGSIGTILSSIVVFSMGEMKTTGWTPTTAVCVAAFSICMLGVYSFVPIYLQLGSATSLNLSLLTSDVYAVVADTVLFHKQLDKRYFGGFVVIVLGILTFNYQSFARIRACSTQPHVHKETLP
eukprot:c8423_g1_i3.p1 GENE.c8423_g1_i3~~c8423_g1_i3.p1  ORF type:complete len:340 (-),score=69.94 c8423_g1_i3:41-1060(-)